MFFGGTTERTASELAVVALIWGFYVAKTAAFLWRNRVLKTLGEPTREPRLSAKRRGAAALRIVAASVLALLFLDPTLTRRIAEKAPPIVLLDDSASVARPFDGGRIDARRGETVWSRIVAAARVVDEAARRRGLTAKFQTLSGRTFATAAEISNELPKTDRFAASPLRTAAENALKIDARSPEGSARSGSRRVLLLSDGIAADAPPTSQRSEKNVASGAEIDSVAFGVSRPALDWRLDRFDATSSVFPNESAFFSADLRLENAEKNGARRAVARLWEAPRKDAASAEGVAPRLVWEESVVVETDENGAGAARLSRTWEPNRDGVSDFFLWIADFEDEDRAASFDAIKNDALEFFEFCPFNNAVAFSVLPRSQRIDVLLIDDEPRREYRYLRELLRREESISLRTLLFSADAETRRADPTSFSLDEFERRTLAKFDVVIVGDVPAERWEGRFERLVDVVLRDDSSTSIWLLPGEKTATAEFWRAGPAARLAPNATFAADAPFEGRFSVAPTPKGRAVYPDLARFFAEIDSSDPPTKSASPFEIFRVFPAPIPSGASETLLSARPDGGGPDVPLLVLSTPGKNKIFRQATDEIWRLQTLDDKTLYRRFVLRTLELSTDQVDGDSERDAFAPSAEIDERAELSVFRDAENFRARIVGETSDVAARADLLREISDASGGESLDLRDRADPLEPALRAFLERRLADSPDVFAEESRRIAPKNVAIPLVFLLFFAAWFLEARADRGIFRQAPPSNG